MAEDLPLLESVKALYLPGNCPNDDSHLIYTEGRRRDVFLRKRPGGEIEIDVQFSLQTGCWWVAK